MTRMLDRFVEAQRLVYDRVVAELRTGHKHSHWMWFIFPQIAGLWNSEMSRRYAISDLNEAVSYAGHALLGPRLIECTELVLTYEGKTLEEMLGHPDNLKFHSSMTLFNAANPSEPAFKQALNKFFLDRGDDATISRLIAS